MNTDRYTRILLTVIAASLALDAGSRLFAIPEALAATQTLRCEIDDVVKVEGTIKTEGTIQIDTFSKPIGVKAVEPIPIKEQKY